MSQLEDDLKQISERGDRYGGHGGILDLLKWCNKEGVIHVTMEEARLFLENPNAPSPQSDTDEM